MHLVLLFVAGAAVFQADAVAPSACTLASEEARQAARAALERVQPHLLGEDWTAAESGLHEALRHDPGHALGRYALGQTLLGLGRPAEAAEAFRGSRSAFRCALSADPEQRQALERQRRDQIRRLRRMLRQLESRRLRELTVPRQEMNSRAPRPSPGRQARVARELEALLDRLERLGQRTDPAPPFVTYALGTALLQAGDLDAAERELRAAVAAESELGDAHNNLALALMLLGRLDEAESEGRRAEQLGVSVNPRLFEEIKRRRQASPPHDCGRESGRGVGGASRFAGNLAWRCALTRGSSG